MDDRRLRELEAKLEIYKSTLTEIYERYDQKLEELSLVRLVGDALRTTMTVESLASALMATVAHEVSADRLALILREPPDDPAAPLRLRAAYHADRELFEYWEEGAGALVDPAPLGAWLGRGRASGARPGVQSGPGDGAPSEIPSGAAPGARSDSPSDSGADAPSGSPPPPASGLSPGVVPASRSVPEPWPGPAFPSAAALASATAASGPPDGPPPNGPPLAGPALHEPPFAEPRPAGAAPAAPLGRPRGFPAGLRRPAAADDAPARLDPLVQDPAEGPRALLAAPFMVRDRFLGLLLLSRPAGFGFTDENVHMLSIMADQAGAALANVQLFDDLTGVNAKLVQSEARALETSRYLERLLESANDAILTLDARGLVTYANRKAVQWGWGKDELLGREFRAMLDPAPADWPPGGPPPVDAIVEAVLVNQQGDRRTVLISASEVGAGDPEPAGGEGAYLIMVGDVTERRQLERQLLHSEKLASIGVLAAGVAHEVGNPLSAISGYAQILGAGVESAAERAEYLTAILNQTERIQKILRELLDYSRPSRGLSETLDLARRLPAVMGMLEGQRAFSRLRVVYDFPPGPWLVTLDRDHLAQVVVIMAMNAAQAMAGQLDPPPTLTMSLAREGGLILMRLSDNGPGMSPEVRRRVFDPFFTTKSPGQGTGLGLAICQRIVESYRGRLDLETAEGEGAAFTIRWPAAGAEPGAPENGGLAEADLAEGGSAGGGAAEGDRAGAGPNGAVLGAAGLDGSVPSGAGFGGPVRGGAAAPVGRRGRGGAR